jgi:hypothetical protein
MTRLLLAQTMTATKGYMHLAQATLVSFATKALFPQRSRPLRYIATQLQTLDNICEPARKKRALVLPPLSCNFQGIGENNRNLGAKTLQ